MKKTTILLTLFAIAALAVACSGTGAREVSTAPPPAIPQETETTAERLEKVEAALATLEVRSDELDRREEILDEREGSVAMREEDVEQREDSLLMREVAFEVAPQPEPPPAAYEPPPVLPEPPVVPARPERIVALPAATELELELTAPLSSESSLAGERVVALLPESVFAEGVEAIPAGSRVVGSVVEAVPQKKFGGQARLTVLFDAVEMPGGYRAEIQAPFEVVGVRQKKKDAATIGGAAAGGAVLGGILGKDKGKGALIGGLIGAAAGTIAARENRGDPVELESGDRIRIRLELPLHVALNGAGESPKVSA